MGCGKRRGTRSNGQSKVSITVEMKAAKANLHRSLINNVRILQRRLACHGTVGVIKTQIEFRQRGVTISASDALGQLVDQLLHYSARIRFSLYDTSISC